jgi:ribonuclease kappa
MPNPKLNKLHICGPGLSVCCSLLSIWGIIMLVILGGLLSVKSAAFIEDIPIKEGGHEEHYRQEINDAYAAAARNCFGATGLYVACLIFCGVQVFFNVRASQLKQQQ